MKTDWKNVPVNTALAVGFISIESDVWFCNGAFYVGHGQDALTTTRTFESLYINPILDLLKRQNPANSSFLMTNTHNRVFNTSGGQTLYLFVDVKTDGVST